MSEKTRKILALLNLSLDDINNRILSAEWRAKGVMERIMGDAEKSGVVIRIDESYNISRFVADAIGVDHLKPSYQEHFQSYTCRCSAWFLLWYAVRDSIPDYYHWLSAEVNIQKKTIKIRGNLYGHAEKLIKSFQNGNNIFELTEDILETFDHIKLIHNFFEGKMRKN